MSEIFNNVIIVIYYIIDVFFIIPIITTCLISRGFWVAYCILVLNIINWISNNINKLYVLLYNLIIFLIFILIILINIPSAGEDLEILYPKDILSPNNRLDYISHTDKLWECESDIYYSNYSRNVTYMSGNEDWESNFFNNPKGYNDLLFADKNSISNMFKGNTSISENNIMNKQECNSCFQNTVSEVVTKRLRYFDTTKYTVEDTLSPTRFDALYKGIISTKASNSSLDLNWRELCRLYAITHHTLTPFDINDIKSYTPETFYTHLQTLHNDKPLCPNWQWPLNKYPNKKNELYAYMRIVEFSINNK
jgi:hypothetical protein